MELIDYYLYSKEHEWINIEDNIGTVGITEYAQHALGDITFVELPEVGLEVEQFEEFVSIESVKAASDIYSPISGQVLEVNENLIDHPELINKRCYDKGWIARIEISDDSELSNLLTEDEYRKYLESLDG